MIDVASVWGGMLVFLVGLMKFMCEVMLKYGEVFIVLVFYKWIMFLIGFKVSEFFFKAKDTEMS